MSRRIVVVAFAVLCAVVSAACDTNTPVPPTPLLVTATTTPIIEATQVVAPTATHARASWQLFTSEDGKFSVQMPGKPQESTRPVQNTLGELTLHSFAAEDGDAAYTIFFMDFPESVQKADPSDLLNAALTRVEGSNTVTNQKKIDVAGSPGVTVEGENGNKGYMRYEAVLAKTRLYELIVLTPNSSASDSDTQRFLQSFQIIKQ